MPWIRARLWAIFSLVLIYLLGMLLLSFSQRFDNEHGLNHGFTSSRRGLGAPVYDGGTRRPSLRGARLHWCAGLRYLEPPRYTVALASFPGSGNTWLRYLIQQATGIYTGSVYKDYGLLKNGFPGESVNNGSVLVVKTHEWGPIARGMYHKAVLLVRAPGPAIQAEFNRQSGGHVGFATPDRYKRAKGKFWQQFVHDKLSAWKQTNLDWLYNFTGPTHVLFYEKLVENVEDTLKNLLDFLGYPVPANMLSCALDRKEGIYRRRKRVLNFDPYSSTMKKKIQLEQDKVYQQIKTVVNGKNLKFETGIFKFT